MDAVESLGSTLSLQAACRALGISRATFYRRRRRRAKPHVVPPAGSASPRRLSDGERRQVLAVLHSERFVDAAPAEIYAALLDEGRYLCSERTMYRLLTENKEVRERRNQLRHPSYRKPELLATAPNQVWSWDITKLRGPVKWVYYSLYVVLDIFSRYVVGWLLAERESQSLARQLLAETVDKQQISRGQLTIHGDRGPTMVAKSVALLLSDLGVHKSHSRPHTSDDNPYSEANFKTLKYHPSFPDRFGSPEDARGVLSLVFPLVQHRTPPLWTRFLDARDGPLRPNPAGPRGSHQGLGRRLRQTPGTLYRRAAQAQDATGSRLDQPAQTAAGPRRFPNFNSQTVSRALTGSVLRESRRF